VPSAGLSPIFMFWTTFERNQLHAHGGMSYKGTI
jgi:hypothetical protein